MGSSPGHSLSALGPAVSMKPGATTLGLTCGCAPVCSSQVSFTHDPDTSDGQKEWGWITAVTRQPMEAGEMVQ